MLMHQLRFQDSTKKWFLQLKINSVSGWGFAVPLMEWHLHVGHHFYWSKYERQSRLIITITVLNV
jgi:hypothetical protein